MQEGESKKVLVQAADAYGEFDPNMVVEINRASFPKDFEIRLGEPMNLRDRTGNMFQAIAVGLTEDTVELDLNHPMAGKDLEFDVTILRSVPPRKKRSLMVTCIIRAAARAVLRLRLR